MSLDDSAGSEIKTGRPAVVVSGDLSNEKEDSVIVAFITSGGFSSPYNVTVVSPDGKKRVLCRQLRTVDKSRLTRFEYKLSGPELIRVTGALAGSMCIPLAVKKDSKDSDEVIALKAECDMWKRSYDAAMNQLVELKVNSDLTLRMARVGYEYEESEDFEETEEAEVEETPVVEPVVTEPPTEEPEQEEPERVEINTCTAEDLKRCGCTAVVATTIIAGRPYMSVEDLRRIPGITSVGFGILKHKICCVPVKVEEPKVEEPEQKIEESEVVVEAEEPVEVVLEVPKKVNINTATSTEIMEHLGIGRFYPGKIVTHRNKHGKFIDLEELKMVEGLSKGFYDQYKDMLTIGEDEQPKEQKQPEEPVKTPEAAEETTEKVVTEKVNINTASAGELHTKLDLSMTVCYSITGVRKRNGLYKSIEELRQVPRFTEFHWEKYKDMLTVGSENEDDGEPDEEPKSDKLNINTASLRDLMDVGFEKRAAALIVNERKKFGRFRSVDDLAGIPEITGKILRKLRDKLEV